MKFVTPASALFVLLPALVLVGCADQSAMLKDINDAYQSARFADARSKALELEGKSSGKTKEQAQYFAGISAYGMGQDEAAMSDLQPLVKSSDPAIAGSAAATCGIICYDRVQDAQAMAYLKIAEGKVTGEDKARVYYHMGLIDQRAGRWDDAKREMTQAISATKDMKYRKVIEQRMSARAFTLQFGAYSQQKLADLRAAAIRKLPGGAGVRLMPSMTADGKSLYLVQAGNYTTYEQAAAAKRTMNVKDSIIVPLVEYHQ